VYVPVVASVEFDVYPETPIDPELPVTPIDPESALVCTVCPLIFTNPI
jgi:hypothetical protein